MNLSPSETEGLLQVKRTYMRKIPAGTRKQIDLDPFYKTCIRAHEGTCQGRITIEHSLYYQGRQISDPFALLPLCWHHHLNDNKKRFNQWVALNRASDEALAKYPKADWKRLREYLNHVFGEYASNKV